ncbi:MAG: hypothetical protein N4A76_14785 [Firmicutes bacterium]|jgi:hypothetical protein|nr:hypothetical protein [Bacillota bacterium]
MNFNVDTQLILIVMFFVIIVSIQWTLNKILNKLEEIKNVLISIRKHDNW